MRRLTNLSPQLLITTAAITGLLAGAAWFTLLPNPWNTPDDLPAPINIQSTIPLDRYEVEALHRQQITLQAWAETKTKTAQAEPSTFINYLADEPIQDCTDEHWPATTPGETITPPAMTQIESIFRCNKLNGYGPPPAEGQWGESMKKLSQRLWHATSPIGGVTLQIASHGYLATEGNSDALREYARIYEPCRTDASVLKWHESEPADSNATAQQWLRLLDHYQTCIRSKTEERFPAPHDVPGPKP